eukprot:GHVL01013942.1.p1 GENE.GHVL01013942.1~~GHVL01013942.1.p1  ORF type:complete len:109 (+),score=8.46 GHVL01013942.1:881-1207(+)
MIPTFHTSVLASVPNRPGDVCHYGQTLLKDAQNGRLRSVPLLWQPSLVGAGTGPRTVVWNGGIIFRPDCEYGGPFCQRGFHAHPAGCVVTDIANCVTLCGASRLVGRT